MHLFGTSSFLTLCNEPPKECRKWPIGRIYSVPAICTPPPFGKMCLTIPDCFRSHIDPIKNPCASFALFQILSCCGSRRMFLVMPNTLEVSGVPGVPGWGSLVDGCEVS